MMKTSREIFFAFSLLLVASCRCGSDPYRLILEKDYEGLLSSCRRAPGIIGSYSDNGKTLIGAAILEDDTKALRIILSNTKGMILPIDGETLQAYILRGGKVSLLKHVLSNRDLDFDLGRSYIGSLHEPVMIRAVASESPEMIHFLVSELDYSPDVYETVSDQYPPPLLWAAVNSHWKSVMALVETGADVNVVARGRGGLEKGQTALMLAAEAGELDTVRFLLRNGANRDLHDSSGKTALDYANPRQPTKFDEPDPFAEPKPLETYKEIAELLRANQ